jgi:hypothetical protein
MNDSMNYTDIKLAIESQTCPLHNIRPLVKIENGKITLRCCCDYFTSKCMAELDQKLRGQNLMNITDAWEEDLFKQERRVA